MQLVKNLLLNEIYPGVVNSLAEAQDEYCKGLCTAKGFQTLLNNLDEFCYKTGLFSGVGSDFLIASTLLRARKTS